MGIVIPMCGHLCSRFTKIMVLKSGTRPGPGIDDQQALLENHLRQGTDLPWKLEMISSRGSGERLDREELYHAEAKIETGAYDLVISEDLGRILRRVRAFDFCEMCEDHDTRLIAINDFVDTANDGWRTNALFVSLRHETCNRDTSHRIRRSHRHRFENGGLLQILPYGYVKPPGATHDSQIQKDPDAVPVIAEIVRQLEEGATVKLLTGLMTTTFLWVQGLVGSVGRTVWSTHPAVQNAIRLARQMKALGIGDPYVALTEPPEGDKRMRRHKHRRYRFEPLK